MNKFNSISKKMFIFAAVIAMAFTAILCGCDKSENGEIGIAESSYSFIETAEIQKTAPIKSEPAFENEEQAEIALNPLILAGKAIYNEVMPQLINSQEWQELSAEDQENIENFPAYGYALLAVIFTDYPKIDNGYAVVWTDVLGCIGAALGVENIGWNLLYYGSGKAITRGAITAILRGIASGLAPWVGAVFVAVTVAGVYACLRALEKGYYKIDNDKWTYESENITISTDVNRIAYPLGAVLVS
jgi:hypothetical protein